MPYILYSEKRNHGVVSKESMTYSHLHIRKMVVATVQNMEIRQVQQTRREMMSAVVVEEGRRAGIPWH